MVIYAEKLQGAIEPPVVELVGGDRFVGKILSYEQFIEHEEKFVAYYIKSDVDKATSQDVRKQLQVARDYLTEVFPPPEIPSKPEAKDLSFFEKIKYWITGKYPEHRLEYIELLNAWATEKDDMIKNSAIERIMGDPALFSIIAQLFTCQMRAMGLKTPEEIAPKK